MTRNEDGTYQNRRRLNARALRAAFAQLFLMLLCPREGLPTLALRPAFEGPAKATIQSVYLLKARAGLPGKRLGLPGGNQQLCWDGHQPPPGQIDTRRAKPTLGAQPFCLAQIAIHRALGLGLKSSILPGSCPEHCRDGLDGKTVPDPGLTPHLTGLTLNLAATGSLSDPHVCGGPDPPSGPV